MGRRDHSHGIQYGTSLGRLGYSRGSTVKAHHLQRSKTTKAIKAKKNNIKQHSVQNKDETISNEVKFCRTWAKVADEMQNDMTAAERKIQIHKTPCLKPKREGMNGFMYGVQCG